LQLKLWSYVIGEILDSWYGDAGSEAGPAQRREIGLEFALGGGGIPLSVVPSS